MSLLSKLRLPYRDDSLFGFLFLAVLVVPLAFDFFNFENFEVIKFGLLALFVGAACLVFFKRHFNSKTEGVNLRLSPVAFSFLGLFLFWALLASLLAYDKNYSFFGFYPRFTNGFFFYLLWAALFLVVAALSKQQIWTLIKTLFFCSTIIALWGLLQSVGFGYYNGLTVDFFSRSAPSFLGNPNFSSMFVSVLVPVGLYLFQVAKSFSGKVYYSVCVFFQIWAIIIFASRGAIVALMFGVVVCLFLSLVFRRQVLGKFVLTALVCLVLIFGLTKNFLNFSRPGTLKASISFQESNIQERFSIWRLTWKSIKLNPIFGEGLGNFELLFEKNRSETSVKTGFFDDPHNLYLYLAATGGLVFLGLFLFLVLYPVFRGLKKLLSQKQNHEALEIISLSGAIGAWLVAAFFTPVAIACYLLLVFLISPFFIESVSYKISKVLLVGRAGKIIAGAIMVYALFFITAEHLFFASIQYYKAGDFSKSHSFAQAAIYLNPVNNLYYEYLAGSGIRGNLPLQTSEKNILAFSRFHHQRSYTYTQKASLYYLLLYQTQNIGYKTLILESLNKAIALDPFSANNYFNLSQYQLVFGDLSASVQSVQKGLSLAPGSLEATMFLAKAYQYQGDRQMLVKTLEEAMRIFPERTELGDLLKLAKDKTFDLNKMPFKVSINVGKLD